MVDEARKDYLEISKYINYRLLVFSTFTAPCQRIFAKKDSCSYITMVFLNFDMPGM